MLYNVSLCYCQTEFDQIAKPHATVQQLIMEHNQSPRSDTYYLLALADARKDNYAEAEKEIKAGLSLDPYNVRLIDLRGAILARQGHLELARASFLDALRLNPKDKYANIALREVKKQLSPLRVIIRHSSPPKMPVIQPQSPVVSNGHHSEAKTLTPHYFIAIKDKQRCFYNMSMLQNAYNRSVKMNPKNKGKFVLNDFVAQKLIPSVPICPDGGVYSFKDNEVTCSVHGKISEVGAEVKTVFSEFNKGMRYKITRNYLDALKAFEQVVVLYPMWSEAHYQLADTLFRTGETDAAIAEVRTCLKNDSNNVDALLLLANLYYKKGQKEAAIKILNKVLLQHKGTVYSLAARSISSAIKSGKNYYQVFPPN